MNRTRTVAGLDVHKDSIYLCIMGYDQAIIWENTYWSAYSRLASDAS